MASKKTDPEQFRFMEKKLWSLNELPVDLYSLNWVVKWAKKMETNCTNQKSLKKQISVVYLLAMMLWWLCNSYFMSYLPHWCTLIGAVLEACFPGFSFLAYSIQQWPGGRYVPLFFCSEHKPPDTGVYPGEEEPTNHKSFTWLQLCWQTSGWLAKNTRQWQDGYLIHESLA